MAGACADDPGVGTQVRMKGTNRPGTIREVLKIHGRVVYYVVQDAIPEETATALGASAAERTTYCTADAFDVLSS